MRQYYLYFLLRRKKIIYIGISFALLNRIQSHSHLKDFNEIRIIPCESREKAMYYERRWTLKFLPEDNMECYTKSRRIELGMTKERMPEYLERMAQRISIRTGEDLNNVLNHPMFKSQLIYD